MTTSYCYDPFNLRHHLAGHPENRERLRGVWALLQSDGILATLLETPCTPASDEQLLRVHQPASPGHGGLGRPTQCAPGR